MVVVANKLIPLVSNVARELCWLLPGMTKLDVESGIFRALGDIETGMCTESTCDKITDTDTFAIYGRYLVIIDNPSRPARTTEA